MSKRSLESFKLDAFLPYRLSIASLAVSSLIASAYAKRFGLSIPEWRLVAVLHEDKSATQKELVRRTLMDKVAVSRAAQSLEDRGLIQRKDDAKDGRALRASLTTAGHALFSAIEPAALAYERRLLQSFAKTEIKQLHDMLRRLEEAAENASVDEPHSGAGGG